MIYRKLSLFLLLLLLFFLFSLSLPLCSGKIRETRASPYGSSSYGQDGTDFHDRRIFTAAYYELFPSFPPALSGLSATYDLPSLVVSLPETAPLPPRGRDRGGRERGKRGEPVVFASRSYFGERVRPRKPRFPSSLSTAVSTLIPGSGYSLIFFLLSRSSFLPRFSETRVALLDIRLNEYVSMYR